ncbi:MAG: hypothetical protein ACXVRS_17140 [Gaiellaceae bacterium]
MVEMSVPVAATPRVRRGEELGQRAYWLRNCSGFRVFEQGRKAGTVSACLLDHETREVASLLISGFLRLTFRVVPASDVVAIEPGAMHLHLASRGE